MKYFAAAVLTLIALQTAAVVWIAVSWELARRQTIAIMEETNEQFRSSAIVREVPVTDVEPRPLTISEVVRDIPVSEFEPMPLTISGEGSGDETVVVELSSGIWTVDLIWGDGAQPPNWVWSGTIASVDDFGQLSWTGERDDLIIYVGLDQATARLLDAARFTPGEVAVTTNAPPGVSWTVAFTPWDSGVDRRP